MSILATKDTHVVIQGGLAGVNAARRMAEFRYMIKQPLNVSAFVYPPDAGKTNEIICGTELIMIPIYKTVAEATAHHPEINTSLVYIGADRAYAGTLEALNDPHIKTVSMITGISLSMARIFLTACTPLTTGISMSINITSGFNCCRSFSIVSALGIDASISKPGCSLINASILSRNASLSS